MMNWYFSIAGHCFAFCFHSAEINSNNFRVNRLMWSKGKYLFIYFFYSWIKSVSQLFKIYTLIHSWYYTVHVLKLKICYAIHYHCLVLNKILPITFSDPINDGSKYSYGYVRETHLVIGCLVKNVYVDYL